MRDTQYSKITPAKRIAAIYKSTVNKMPLSCVARETGINYNTLRNILFTYFRTGRVNKMIYRKEQLKGVSYTRRKMIGKSITSLNAIGKMFSVSVKVQKYRKQ